MSIKSAYLPLQPWFDHWNTPSPEQLLKDVKETHLTVLPTLREQLRQMPGVEERLVWMGDAWKWTFEYTLPGHHVSGPESPDAFCYLVPATDTLTPHLESPLLVFPIADSFIDFVPFKRLNRYVRDGIKSGKLAVDLIWITWAPGPGPELEHLIDILKRKYKFLMAPPKAGEVDVEDDVVVPPPKVVDKKTAGKAAEKAPESKKSEVKKTEKAEKTEVKKPAAKKEEVKKPAAAKKPEAKKAAAKPEAKKPAAKPVAKKPAAKPAAKKKK